MFKSSFCKIFRILALLTGELSEVTKLAPAGKKLRFSLDDRFASFASDSHAKQIIHVFAAANCLKRVADSNGHNEVFAPSGRALVFLRQVETETKVAEVCRKLGISEQKFSVGT